ncbi:methylmalonyl-CoA epimerase [Chishuiella changwenlii]|jgi:methylmalonyl-CoA/ethylmalonyl-CoA epimerase|uniref:Methylmalonyl-CoA epimerase n=1 Tax=Chishuiella changwenlii TaxID=1434701 RepID=A0A1M6UUR8_9FLAO|nr:methylmalonyl-CoA epimerase [Chishuiella changwenlii]GGF07900.1 methylmalonyl-CoA epimerase [Chishuiella changwenlii]SHK72948.1 methylmalonyl-CoA epimerase [Chishuiella changwenlii]
MKIEHIGIAVKDLGISNDLFEKLLGKSPYKEEVVDTEGVRTSFFEIGESKIELVGSEKKDSAIEKFLEKNREGIHHIAFGVENLEVEIERLKNEGFIFINETPKLGADNKRIVFLHPKTTNGVLIELCEDVK